uniref:Putative tick transposon n=1 Tax=Rhipicephalus pulchellus TaxID=72859 RepID=L7LUB5_RHIPC
MSTLNSHFSPTPLETAESFCFRSRVQLENESIAEFAAELRQIAEHCNFGTALNHMLRDRLVCGIRDRAVQQRLLTEKNQKPHFGQSRQDCKNGRGGRTPSKRAEQGPVGYARLSSSRLANHLKFKKRHEQATKGQKAQELNARGKTKAGHDDNSKPCVRCGSRDYKPPECKHINTRCYKCDKVGHLASCCLSSADKGRQQRGSQVNTVQSTDKPPEYYLHSLQTQSPLKPITMTFIVNGVPLEMELDSGSPVFIISKDTYLQHQGALPVPSQTDIKLNCIRGTIPVQGTLSVDVRIGKTASQQTLLVAFADELILTAESSRGLRVQIDQLSSFLVARGLEANAGKSSSLVIEPSGWQKHFKIRTDIEFQTHGKLLAVTGCTSTWRYLGVHFSVKGLQKGLLRKQLMTLREKVSKAEDDGLGVAWPRTTIPAMRLRRYNSVAHSTNAPCAFAATRPTLTNLKRQAEALMTFKGSMIDSSKQSRKFWGQELHRSFDGRPLDQCKEALGSTSWLSKGTSFLRGKEFIDLLKFHIGATPNLTRLRRGRDLPKQCRAGCDPDESLDHILQKCHRTHHAHVKRHNNILKYLSQRLTDLGWKVQQERHFKTSQGTKIPDLVIGRDARSRILDVQVVVTCVALMEVHQHKADKYKIPDLPYQISPLPLVSSVALTYRGTWAGESVKVLLEAGLCRKDFKMMAIDCIQGWLAVFRIHQQTTAVRPENRGPDR